MRSRVFVVLSLASCAGQAAGHPPFQPLGVLPGYSWSRAYAGGGSQTIVGECGGGPADAPVRAFYWLNDGTGMHPLPAARTTIPIEARAMSWNGPLGGVGANGATLLWTGPLSNPPLVLPPANIGGRFEPLASAYVAAAPVVVGVLHTIGRDVPTRWSASGGYMTIPPLATGQADGSATAIAAVSGGPIIVGRMTRPGEAGGQAFRWSAAGTVGLGWFSTDGAGLPDSTATSIAYPYGDVIVGFSTGGRLPVGAFRYTVAGGMVELGALPGAIESRAMGIVPTGATTFEVAGDCTYPDGHHEAFLWDSWLGMMSLRDVLLACGADIPPGWTLDEVAAWPYDEPLIVNGHDPTGAAVAVVARPRLCYANCDLSSASPRLNVSDFVCFINRFLAGEDYANCDHSTVPPVLNVLDFMCFVDKYVAGCSIP